VVQLLDASMPGRTTRAQVLRGLLKSVIEELHPQEGVPGNDREWRSYKALQYRYVYGMSLGEIEHELGISERQLQRELHKGLGALVSILWDRRKVSDGKGQPNGVASNLEEVDDIQSALTHWQINYQSCSIETLLAGITPMLTTLMEQKD
jgi:hypothetical protein